MPHSLEVTWTTTWTWLIVVASLWAATSGHAEESELPEVKFFYYDSGRIEWIVSAEPASFQQHLAENSNSNTLFESLTATVHGGGDEEKVRDQINRWLEAQRENFGTSENDQVLYRKAEGIAAYLRAHDFSITNLVSAIKKRSGADRVELVGVHLVGKREPPQYKLKVVLNNPTVGLGKQGFQIDIRSPEVSGVSAVYALGVALYEVHEIINRDDTDEESPPPDDSDSRDQLPTPSLELVPPTQNPTEAQPTPALRPRAE